MIQFENVTSGLIHFKFNYFKLLTTVNLSKTANCKFQISNSFRGNDSITVYFGPLRPNSLSMTSMDSTVKFKSILCSTSGRSSGSICRQAKALIRAKVTWGLKILDSGFKFTLSHNELSKSCFSTDISLLFWPLAQSIRGGNFSS